jgi:protein SCO1/2
MSQFLRDKPWALGVLVLVIAGAAIGVWQLAASEAHEWNGMAYEPAREIDAIRLTDSEGESLALTDLEGKPVLIYFGYTFCPDFCPATLTDFQRVKQDLGDQADEVAYVMITVDPARDTPERLRDYLEFFDPTFIGLTGSENEITDAKRAFGITSISQPATPEANGFYFVDHSTQTYLLDQEGDLILEYPWGTEAGDIAEDIDHLLD